LPGASPAHRQDKYRDCTEPFFRIGKRRKITHVQAESLASFLETAADEKAEAFELGCSGFDSAMGVVEEHKLSTNGLPLPAFGLLSGNPGVLWRQMQT